MNDYLPEGQSKNRKYTLDGINNAIQNKDIISGKVIKCSNDYSLTIDLGENITGKISLQELEVEKPSNKKASAISKVGKTIKFIPIKTYKENSSTVVECSRKQAQKRCIDEYISKLSVGDIIKAKALKYETYGIFCDIGCGITALLPTGRIRVPYVVDPVKENKILKDIYVVINKIHTDGKIELTHKELLGTWDEEISNFQKNDIVIGKVVSKCDYGYFIMISQNLCGLAKTEDIDIELELGDTVSVTILHISKANKRVRLQIIKKLDSQRVFERYQYYKLDNHLDIWEYYTGSSNRTEFM